MSSMLAKAFCEFRSAAGYIAKEANLKIAKLDASSRGIVFMALICAVLPLDISQLMFAVVGAVGYAMLQNTATSSPKKKLSPVARAPAPHLGNPQHPWRKPNCLVTGPSKIPKPQLAQQPEQVRCVEFRKTRSVQPVLAPTFYSKGWESEVQELVNDITPTAETHQIVTQLAQMIQTALQSKIRGVEVTGVAFANLTCGKAFGVAVPEVEMVATVSPRTLFECLHGPNNRDSLDEKKLQKIALRVCAERLTESGFKFRRSNFKVLEPKITLLAPSSLGLCTESIPLDFHMNVVTPLYNAALFAECGAMDGRAKDLILLVKRWAKDRGICHASKGHLSPYIWSTLAIYFLQVRKNGEGPLLPALEHFKLSTDSKFHGSAAACTRPTSQWIPAQNTEERSTNADLFKEFIHFFQAEFDWSKETVSIRAGQRAPAGPAHPWRRPAEHILVSDDGKASEVGPTIEDPRQVTQNLGSSMDAGSFGRLKEELARAQKCCMDGASLSELLEPWTPADP